MVQSACSAMEREIHESADVVSRIVRNRRAIAEVARHLDIGVAPLVAVAEAPATPAFFCATSSKQGCICRCPPVRRR